MICVTSVKHKMIPSERKKELVTLKHTLTIEIEQKDLVRGTFSYDAEVKKAEELLRSKLQC